MIAAASKKLRKLVMMKESSVPAPATPASVGVVSGTTLQSPENMAVGIGSNGGAEVMAGCNNHCE
jgi:hypothetical protein